MKKKFSTFLILHNIRSTHNVGSIFRSADAAGVSKIYLTGYTPAPIDAFKRPRKDIAKVALGAEKNILWERGDAVEILSTLKKDGFKTIALEQSSQSIDYKKITVDGDCAIVLGNEVGGVDVKILEMCDVVAEIPMSGQKESLNVSVAAGIFLFRVLDK